MPTALETLVKILKQEKETGCENKTVIGGLGAYSTNWQRQAKEQAKRAEHLVLADELVNILAAYDRASDKSDRLKKIQYMLDRITGRAPIPSEYASQLEQARAEIQARQPSAPPSAPPPVAQKPPRDRSERREKKEATAKQRTQDETRPQPERREKPDKKSKSERPGSNRSQNTPPITDGVEPENPPTQNDVPSRRERLERLERPEPTAHEPRGERERPERERKEPKPERERREPRPIQREERAKSMRPEPSENKGDMGREAMDYDIRAIDGGELDIKPLPRLARPPRGHRQHLSLSDAQKRLTELKQSVTIIKGIGQKVAQTLEPMGIYTVEDMIYYLPRRYDDYTQLLYIRRLVPNTTATVIATIKTANVRIGQNNRKDFALTVEDGTGTLFVTFFGMYFLQSKLRPGMQIVLSGKVTIYRSYLQMSNPEWELVDSENLNTVGIVPVYRVTEGVKPRSFRRTMKQVVDTWANQVPDYVPQATLERSDLADLGWAIRNLHFPDGFDHLHHAQRRRVFDELLLLQLAILGNRREWQGVPGRPLEVTDDFLETFISTVFPYELTGAQRRSIEDIRRDVYKTVPMNRLVQGDVGAGKTAVAITALGMALANGKQGAMMAPTSILAEQHYRGISRAFANYPAEQKPVIGLLTGSLSNSERESIYRGLADGSIDIIVGTHALIQEGVEFNDLAVAVIDEQHRFGVEQRARLRGKGYNPHVLVMTATPIPRTLALTLYADLDLSVIDEKPQGRLPIQTQLVLPNERTRAYSFVEAQLELGRQAFVVHPLVEASDKIDARSAIEAYDELKAVFYKYRVCLLHGRMKPAEKDEVMSAFSRHEYDVMVTTSVAEVGVDIPNASVMLIESANRFGLAQLHQFRGRVGRGEHPSFCLLMVEPDIFTEDDLLYPENYRDGWGDVQRRLKAMEDTDDGFKLAELDWKLRGAGDLLGARQSGASTLQLAELMTPDLVSLAQREARTIYEEDPALEQPEHHLLRHMLELLGQDNGDVS